MNIDVTTAIPAHSFRPEFINESKNMKSNELVALTFYQQELKKRLPESLFKRTPLRALHLLVFLTFNLGLIYLVVHFDPAWYIKLFAAIMIGQFNAGMAFTAHEILHGSIVKSPRLQQVLGSIGFAPFLVSATYWRFWHNTLHHGNTQLIYRDPDAFPTLSVYKRSKFMQVVFELAPGSGNILSYFYMFYWFSFQAVLNQAYMRFKNKMWANMDHKKVTFEFAMIVAVASIYLYWVGLSNLLWLVVIPLAIQNYVILSYILTNHNISPLTKINDPLENSLTVITNPLSDLLDLNFGYHVEHHLFPRVSGRHAKTIHRLLKEMYPGKYKTMPKWKALKYLYQTPRLYKSSNELVCPKTLKTYPTI